MARQQSVFLITQLFPNGLERYAGIAFPEAELEFFRLCGAVVHASYGEPNEHEQLIKFWVGQQGIGNHIHDFIEELEQCLKEK